MSRRDDLLDEWPTLHREARGDVLSILADAEEQTAAIIENDPGFGEGSATMLPFERRRYALNLARRLLGALGRKS